MLNPNPAYIINAEKICPVLRITGVDEIEDSP